MGEAEKEGAVQRVVAQGWQREVALLEPQLHRLQAQLDAHQQKVTQNLRQMLCLHPQAAAKLCYNHNACLTLKPHRDGRRKQAMK